MGVSDEVRALRQLTENAVLEINRLPERTRQAITDHQWATIPLYVSEIGFNAALVAGADLPVTPQTSGYEVITSIVASVPAGATGLITLGSVVLPIAAGVTTISPIQYVLGTSDVRKLVIAGANGAAALWLTGQQLPTYGVLAH